MSSLLVSFIVAIIAMGIPVRKRKALLYFIIASGLAIIIAFLTLLKRTISYTM